MFPHDALATENGLRPNLTPVLHLALAAIGGLGFVWAVASWLFAATWEGEGLALATFGGAALVACRGVMRHYPHRTLGLANLITLLRVALASSLVALIALPGGLGGREDLAWSAVGIALVAHLLDGADGWLARRNGLATAFGARFDMESDAYLALVLAILVLLSGKAGLWVLALGSMRYAYVAAASVIPWLRRPLPERFRRKAICVVQIAVLIILLAPPVSPPFSVALAAAATLLLAWSFMLDILWQARQR